MRAALLDTQLLLWMAIEPQLLPAGARALIERSDTHLSFSLVSIWEVAIKHSLGREDFRVDPKALRDGLLAAGLDELGIEPQDVLRVAVLPWVHRDPFDRLLVVQAMVRGLPLLTTDRALAAYGPHVRPV